MNKLSLLSLFEKLGIHPSKRLGQNFLLDSNLLRWIVGNIAFANGEHILEIGPGTGSLTDYLIDLKTSVTAIEYDVRLFNYLVERYQHVTNIRFIQADAAQISYDDVVGETSYHCVGNLPYASSSAILYRLLEAKNPPSSMFFLLQKDVALRIQSSHGHKAYNALAIAVQSHYHVNIKRFIPPEVFWPIPKVTSAFIHFSLRQDRPHLSLAKVMRKIVKVSFSQKRKKLFPRLQRSYPEYSWIDIAKKLHLTGEERPETLTVNQYIALAKCIIASQKNQ